MNEQILKIIKYDAKSLEATCPICHKTSFAPSYFKCECLFVGTNSCISFDIIINNDTYVIFQYFDLKKTYIRRNVEREIIINDVVEFNFDDTTQLKDQILTCLLFS